MPQYHPQQVQRQKKVDIINDAFTKFRFGYGFCACFFPKVSTMELSYRQIALVPLHQSLPVPSAILLFINKFLALNYLQKIFDSAPDLVSVTLIM